PAGAVAEFDAADVKRCCVGWQPRWVVDEAERGVGVDEPSYQPGAGRPVDVDAGTGCPVHRGTCGWARVAARSSRAALAWEASSGGKKSRRLIRRSSARSRRKIRARSLASAVRAVAVCAMTAAYSAARAVRIALANSCSWSAVLGRASQRPA